jgi:hypothetical protein
MNGVTSEIVSEKEIGVAMVEVEVEGNAREEGEEEVSVVLAAARAARQ